MGLCIISWFNAKGTIRTMSIYQCSNCNWALIPVFGIIILNSISTPTATMFIVMLSALGSGGSGNPWTTDNSTLCDQWLVGHGAPTCCKYRTGLQVFSIWEWLRIWHLSFFSGRGALCIAGHLAASLASILCRSAALTSTCDNQKCLQISPSVPPVRRSVKTSLHLKVAPLK